MVVHFGIDMYSDTHTGGMNMAWCQNGRQNYIGLSKGKCLREIHGLLRFQSACFARDSRNSPPLGVDGMVASLGELLLATTNPRSSEYKKYYNKTILC